jgi:hypothetical protein
MTLHIYYRHTPVARSSGKSRPAWFTHERCLVNLLLTIKEHLDAGRVRLTVLFDGSETDQQSDFASAHLQRLRQTLSKGDEAVIERRIDGGTQRKAWRACVHVVREDSNTVITQNDIVYLLENDYVHLPGWVDEVLALQQQGVPWDYLTLYDHPDKYPNFSTHHDAKRYAGLASRLYATPTRHWRSTPSTCATYMLRRETFLSDFSVLRLGLYDLRLFRLLRHLRRRQLVSPLPALATHSMEALLSPGVDWDRAVHAAPAT